MKDDQKLKLYHATSSDTHLTTVSLVAEETIPQLATTDAIKVTSQALISAQNLKPIIPF